MGSFCARPGLMGGHFKIPRLAALFVVFLAMCCSSSARATTDSVATPFYTLLAWSPEEQFALVLIQGADGDEYPWQLAQMIVQAEGHMILERTQSDDWAASFRSRIHGLMGVGYRKGRVLLAPRHVPDKGRTSPPLPKPTVPAMNQELVVEATSEGARLALRETLPGIETATVVVADLSERLHREVPELFEPANRNRTIDFYTEQVFVSPTQNWAFVPVTVVTDLSFNAAYYCFPTFFRLASESSKLFNICGYRLYRQKEYERAEEQFVQAFYMDPTNAQAVYNLACVCALTDRPFDAIDYLNRAIALDEKYWEKAKGDPDFDSLRQGGYPFFR